MKNVSRFLFYLTTFIINIIYFFNAVLGYILYLSAVTVIHDVITPLQSAGHHRGHHAMLVRWNNHNAISFCSYCTDMKQTLKFHFTLFVFLVFWGTCYVSCDLFLSVYKLERLASHEAALLSGMKTYVDAQPLGVPAEIIRSVSMQLNSLTK